MPTNDALRLRIGQLSDQTLLAMLASEDSERLTSEGLRALTEEVARRGLRKSTAPAVPFENPAGEPRMHPKASLSLRLIAAAIDAAIVVVPWFVMLWVIFLAAASEHEGIGSIVIIPLFLGTLSYLFLRDARRGQSIGKRAARLMVVSLETGRPCTAGESALRSLVLVLSGLLIPGIGWLIEPIVALVDRDGRRLGDRAADTQVIEVSSYNAV